MAADVNIKEKPREFCRSPNVYYSIRTFNLIISPINAEIYAQGHCEVNIGVPKSSTDFCPNGIKQELRIKIGWNCQTVSFPLTASLSAC